MPSCGTGTYATETWIDGLAPACVAQPAAAPRPATSAAVTTARRASPAKAPRRQNGAAGHRGVPGDRPPGLALRIHPASFLGEWLHDSRAGSSTARLTKHL